MEMVEGGAVGGGDFCCGGDGLAASLPVSSVIHIDIPCQRPPRPSLRCHPTPLPLLAKMAKEAGSEMAKFTMVNDGNLSPPAAVADGFRSGTHLPPSLAAGPFSPVDCHCLTKPLLTPPH
jgi:hypothetical protein